MEQYLSPSGAPSQAKLSPSSNEISTPPLDIEKRYAVSCLGDVELLLYEE